MQKTLLTLCLSALAASAYPSTPTEHGYALIVPEKQATLSAEFIGKIDAINVKDGQAFKSGDTLIHFNCTLQEAELNKAQAVHDSSKIAADSAQQLSDLDSGSLVEVAQAKANFQQAQSEVKRTQALVDQCSINAPFDGKVQEIDVHRAEVIQPGTPMMKIIDHQNLKIKLFVPSKWLAWLKPGTPFKVQLHELNQTYQAHVTQIGAAVDASSQSIKIYGKLDKKSPKLLSGMSGEAYFTPPTS